MPDEDAPRKPFGARDHVGRSKVQWVHGSTLARLDGSKNRWIEGSTDPRVGGSNGLQIQGSIWIQDWAASTRIEYAAC